MRVSRAITHVRRRCHRGTASAGAEGLPGFPVRGFGMETRDLSTGVGYAVTEPNSHLCHLLSFDCPNGIARGLGCRRNAKGGATAG